MQSWRTGRGRIILPGLALLVSLGLLLYGALAGQRTIYQPGEEGTELAALTVSEWEMILDATAGGLDRDPSGRLVRTYKAGEERDKACPT